MLSSLNWRTLPTSVTAAISMKSRNMLRNVLAAQIENEIRDFESMYSED
jgi:hypothetical protein